MVLGIAGCAVERSAGPERGLGLSPGQPLPPGVTAPHPAVAPWRNVAFYGGVVAASEPEAAAAGVEMLRRGGNAVDAVAAAQFALNVVEPQSSGIGGGGFLLLYRAESGETLALDAREGAPRAARPDMFGDAPWPDVSTSGAAVGVPLTIAGLSVAVRRWGRLPLADALEPAISLAEAGFEVGERLAASISVGLQPGGRLAAEPDDPAYQAARQVFVPGGVPLRAGDVLRQPALAHTLRRLRDAGPDAFYACAHPAGIAQAIIAAQRAHRARHPELGGTMTCADLEAAAESGPVVRPPLQGSYRGYRLATMPPPSSGGVALLQMLRMLERFPLGSAEAGYGFGAAPTLALMLDAMRLAFADRAVWLGDPDAGEPLPVAGLLSPAYLAHRSAQCPDRPADDDGYCLQPGRRLRGITAGDPRPFTTAPAAAGPLRGVPATESGTETTHLTAVDRWGNVASYTGTIESAWGSGLMVPGFGFLLNNELTDFNLRPRRGRDVGGSGDPGINDAGPAKRPRSNMTPVIVFAADEAGRLQPLAAFGSPGGPTIINTALNITLNLIDHRLAIQTAIDAPRLSLTSAADNACAAIEPGFATGALQQLQEWGYPLTEVSEIGSVQAAVIDAAAGGVYGGADGRRRGTVAGLAPRAAARP